MSDYSQIDNSIKELFESRDIAVAIKLANEIMELILEGTEFTLPKPIEIYSKQVIPSNVLPNTKAKSWFAEHALIEGERVALRHFENERAPIESKFYQLNESATKAVIAAGVRVTDNWEDRASTRNANYKVGIDFFLNQNDDGLLMVVSNEFNLRILEFKEALTNTQKIILNDIRGIATIKGLDVSGKETFDEAKIAQPELEPQRAIHKKLWDALQIESVNRAFYAGIASLFVELYQRLVECGIDRNEAKVFSTRLIGRIVFVWFLAKKGIVKPLPENYDTYKKLTDLFYETLNTPVEERRVEDKKTPYLNGGLFEKHREDCLSGEAEVPDAWIKEMYKHLSQYNFTTDESSPEYQQVAIDPEMLGCIFESLLGGITIDDNSDITERKIKGAFYTPRQIVAFMCKEALREYLYDNTRSGYHDQVDKLLDTEDAKWVSNHSNSLRDIADVRDDAIAALTNFKVLDPACGSGAFPMGMLQLLTKCYQRLQPKDKHNLYEIKKSILERNIFGVDIEPMAAEISRLRAWLSIMVEVKDKKSVQPLPNLDFKFVCANTLVKLAEEAKMSIFADNTIPDKLDEIRNKLYHTQDRGEKIKLRDEWREITSQDMSDQNEKTKQLATWDPFDTSSVVQFFDPERMFGVPSFDCVIGNPPYVQLQRMDKNLKDLYRSQKFKVYNSMGDIYCLFYERGANLLKDKGVLCFITSNKWMRAGYGAELRDFFVDKVNAKCLIDLGGKIFETATVDTNILLFKNEPYQKRSVCAKLKDSKEALLNLKKFVEENHETCEFKRGESWVILSEIERSIKEKIEKNGVPLKDWDISINYGIKTGCNEAFIIDGETKDALISEDPASAEIIKPILRGCDIRRFGYTFKDKWLIATHNGYTKSDGTSVPSIDIKKYPTVQAWLNKHWDAISKRGDKGATPYNLRNCAYMEDFVKEKVVYSETNSLDNIKIALDKENFYTDKTCFIIHSDDIDIEHIYEQLTSPEFSFYLRTTCPNLGEKGFSMTKETVETFPMLKPAASYSLSPEEVEFLEKGGK